MLKMDLDFLDTSGFVVLPIQSTALPIDSAPAMSSRPYDKLAITQTLDEHRAEEGKLILEVKATAHGLVPPLDQMLDVRVEGFEVADMEDEGVAVSRFDPDSSEPVVVSERLCMVTLKGRQDLPERPKTFTFPAARVDEAEMVYQRYNDADLATVEQVISLEKEYGAVRRPWLWGLAAIVPVGLIGWAGYRAAKKGRRQPTAARFPVPDTITPFSVLALCATSKTTMGSRRGAPGIGGVDRRTRTTLLCR